MPSLSREQLETILFLYLVHKWRQQSLCSMPSEQVDTAVMSSVFVNTWGYAFLNNRRDMVFLLNRSGSLECVIRLPICGLDTLNDEDMQAVVILMNLMHRHCHKKTGKANAK